MSLALPAAWGPQTLHFDKVGGCTWSSSPENPGRSRQHGCHCYENNWRHETQGQEIDFAQRTYCPWIGIWKRHGVPDSMGRMKVRCLRLMTNFSSPSQWATESLNKITTYPGARAMQLCRAFPFCWAVWAHQSGSRWSDTSNLHISNDPGHHLVVGTTFASWSSKCGWRDTWWAVRSHPCLELMDRQVGSLLKAQCKHFETA